MTYIENTNFVVFVASTSDLFQSNKQLSKQKKIYPQKYLSWLFSKHSLIMIGKYILHSLINLVSFLHVSTCMYLCMYVCM